jgi:hypothetical protein
MIVNENEAIKRLNSPMNLMNRLKKESPRNGAMSLFGINRRPNSVDIKTEDKQVEIVKTSFNPFALQTSSQAPAIIPPENPTPVLGDILDNHESQIKLGLAHDSALALLNSSVAMLASKLDDVKAEKLPAVISAASKTVESIRRERNEAAKMGKDKEVHYHFYTPQQKTVADYQVIDVTQ